MESRIWPAQRRAAEPVHVSPVHCRHKPEQATSMQHAAMATLFTKDWFRHSADEQDWTAKLANNPAGVAGMGITLEIEGFWSSHMFGHMTTQPAGARAGRQPPCFHAMCRGSSCAAAQILWKRSLRAADSLGIRAPRSQNSPQPRQAAAWL